MHEVGHENDVRIYVTQQVGVRRHRGLPENRADQGRAMLIALHVANVTSSQASCRVGRAGIISDEHHLHVGAEPAPTLDGVMLLDRGNASERFGGAEHC